MANVALVVLDTLRQDYFEDEFDWLPGTRFKNAWATSHWTSPVHASMFTGRYPSEVGVYQGSQSLNCKETVLAEELQDSGYTTRAISSNIVVSETYKFNRGFDQFLSLGKQLNDHKHTLDNNLFNWYKFLEGYSGNRLSRDFKAVKECIQSDSATVPSLLYALDIKFDIMEKIDKRHKTTDMGSKQIYEEVQDMEFGENEFLYLNLMEAHYPYEIPDEFKHGAKIATPENSIGVVKETDDLTTVRERYKNATRYLSHIYEHIFKELEEDFDYVITVSDHGELLGEHGFYGHSYGVFPELTNIVLSIYSGEDKITYDETNVSLVDMYSTIKSLFDIDDSQSRGRDLSSENCSDGVFITEYHGHSPQKLQKWLNDESERQSYLEWKYGLSMGTGYYGYEMREGFIENGECPISDPESRIQAIVDTLDIKNPSEEESVDISEEVREELNHLGYL